MDADDAVRRHMEAKVRQHLPPVRTEVVRKPCAEYPRPERPRREETNRTEQSIGVMREKRRREVEGRWRRELTRTRAEKAEVAEMAKVLRAYEPSRMRPSVLKYGPSSIQPFKILFQGPPEAGTTSAIRMIERALYGSDDDGDAIPGVPTKHVTEHLTDVDYIRLTDCPRLDQDDGVAMKCLISVAKGVVKLGEVIDPDEHGGDPEPVEREDFSSMFEKHLMVVFVLPSDMLLDATKRGKMTSRYRPVWEYLRVNGYATACIVTHGDSCRGETTEKRLTDLARSVVNSPAQEDSAIVLENYPVYSAIDGTVFPLTPRYDMEKRALKFLSAALDSCEVRLEDRMARARIAAEDVPRPHGDRPGVHPETHIRTFLWQQNEWHGWRHAGLIDAIAEKFAERDIFNFRGLHDCFDCESVSELLPSYDEQSQEGSESAQIPLDMRAAILEAKDQM